MRDTTGDNRPPQRGQLVKSMISSLTPGHLLAHVGSRAPKACLTSLRGPLPLARLQEPLGRSRSAPCFVGAQVPLRARAKTCLRASPGWSPPSKTLRVSKGLRRHRGGRLFYPFCFSSALFPSELLESSSKRSAPLATFRRKIGWRWLLDRIDCFAENCKIGRIWVDVGRDH